MKRLIGVLFALLVAGAPASFGQSIQSPDGKLSLSFRIEGEGELFYELSYGGQPVLRKSRMGLKLKSQPSLITSGASESESEFC